MRSRSPKPARQKKQPPERLGDRIARLRRSKRWSQIELGSRIGMSGAQISKFERGAYQPRADTLPRIAEALETSTDFLLTGSGQVARDPRLRARLPLLDALPADFLDLLVEFLDTVLRSHEKIRRARGRGGKGMAYGILVATTLIPLASCC